MLSVFQAIPFELREATHGRLVGPTLSTPRGDKYYNQYRTGPRSAVGNVSGYRCVSDCRSRVTSSIPVRSHTFVEIDHEMISTINSSLPLIHSRRVVVSYKRKYVHELLVNRLFKPAQEKVWLGELTVPQ